MALTVVCSQAFSLDIVLNPNATLSSNTAALAAFERAATRWENALTDNITVNINAGLASLGSGIIGSTGSSTVSRTYAAGRSQLILDAADEGSSNAIVGFLPTSLSANVSAGSSLSTNMSITTANAKAMGFTGITGADASMTFSTNFSFYFGTGTVPANQMDFETVATHEIGHALGFISAVDGGSTVNATPLDLFRFADSSLPTNTTAFTNNSRALARGQAASFSDTVNSYGFSTGVSGGDGNQASHWKADDITGHYIGIMDPTLDFGVKEDITAADLRAYDLIGWDLAQPVPEPATLAALGMGALAIVRRKRNAKK